MKLPLTAVIFLVSICAAAAGGWAARPARPEPTQLELNQTAAAAYKKADGELNSVYGKIRSVYADEPVFLEKLQLAQRLWVKFRDAEIEARYPPHQEEPGYYGSSHPTCVANHRAKLTTERVAALRAWLTGIEEGDVCAGSIKLPDEIKKANRAK